MISCFKPPTFSSFPPFPPFSPPFLLGEQLRDQVEERLKFYDTGDAPRKNVDVMSAVAESLRKIATKSDKPSKKARKSSGGEEEVVVDEKSEKKEKKEKKRDRESVGAVEEVVEDGEGKKKKKKKVHPHPPLTHTQCNKTCFHNLEYTIIFTYTSIEL